MAMSKKHYQALASALYDARSTVENPPVPCDYRIGDGLVALGHAVSNVADVLARDNPRFNRALFLEACETGTCKGMPKR